MYQIKFSISTKYESWFYAIEEILAQRVANNVGIMASRCDEKRTYISVACENEHKANINQALKDCFVEMFAVVSKLEYIKGQLKLPYLSKPRLDILLHTLVAFDRENEREIITKSVDVYDDMSLDGIFNFKLAELKTRWNEICKLTGDNAAYLNDNATFNELLRFLISAVNPKILKLNLKEEGGMFLLKGDISDGIFEAKAKGSQQLMYYLIDLAPLELIIDGDFKDNELLERLMSIFDAKQCKKSLMFKA